MPRFWYLAPQHWWLATPMPFQRSRPSPLCDNDQVSLVSEPSQHNIRSPRPSHPTEIPPEENGEISPLRIPVWSSDHFQRQTTGKQHSSNNFSTIDTSMMPDDRADLEEEVDEDSFSFCSPRSSPREHFARVLRNIQSELDAAAAADRMEITSPTVSAASHFSEGPWSPTHARERALTTAAAATARALRKDLGRVRKLDPLRYANRLQHPRRLLNTPTRAHRPSPPRGKSTTGRDRCSACGRAFRTKVEPKKVPDAVGGLRRSPRIGRSNNVRTP